MVANTSRLKGSLFCRCGHGFAVRHRRRIFHWLHKKNIVIQKTLGAFLRTDMRYLIQGSFWLSLNKFISMGIALALSMLYAHYMSKDIYGSYRYILSMIGMFGVCAIPGMGTAVIRSMARGSFGAFRTASTTIFLFSFGISIACASTAFYFAYKDNDILAFSFFVASFLVPFSEGLGTWRTYFTATKTFHKGTFLSSGVQIIYGISMISMVGVLILFPLPGFLTTGLLVTTYLLAHSIPKILLTKRVLHAIPKDATHDAGMLPYGFRLSALEIPSTIATYLDSVILYVYLGPSALAIYSFALAPVEQLKSLFGTTATVSMPKLAEKTSTKESNEMLRKTLPRKLFRASIFTACIIALYILSAPLLFQILFPNYMEAVRYTQVFALSMVLFPLSVFGTALKAEGNIKKIYIFSIGEPLVQILAIITLVQLYGLWGAIAARVGGRLLNMTLQTYLYMKK